MTSRARFVGCEGKVKFETFTAAKRQAKKSSRVHEHPLQPYSCDLCGGFHVGTPGIRHSSKRHILQTIRERENAD